MPGVPTGRGCEACRRQKKKCDQSRPACSRCARLGKPCIGAGQQRYKFQESKEQAAVSMELLVQSLTSKAARPVADLNANFLWEPSSERTLLVKNFISKLEVTDIRYNLPIAYGPFLKEIPRRLGHSSALDAAVEAMVASLPILYTRQKSVEALVKYGDALRALRASLSNPSEVVTADTLCAMYVVLMCQGWHREQYDTFTNHAEAMAFMLKAGGFQVWEGRFQTEMLMCICMPVIVGAIGNPKMSWFCDYLINTPPPTIVRVDKRPHFESMRIQTLAKLPGFVANPHQYHAEIRRLYDGLQKDLKTENRSLIHLTELVAVEKATKGVHSSGPTLLEIARAQHESFYALFVAFGGGYNSLLRTCEPNNVHLMHDRARLYDELILVAKAALVRRPLGSAYGPICLSTAWALADDDFKKAEVETIFREYQPDMPEELRMRWEQYRQRHACHPSASIPSAEMKVGDTPDACVVM